MIDTPPLFDCRRLIDDFADVTLTDMPLSMPSAPDYLLMYLLRITLRFAAYITPLMMASATLPIRHIAAAAAFFFFFFFLITLSCR